MCANGIPSPINSAALAAAIGAADVEAGCSRLMGRDEAGTLARLKAIRREVVDPQVQARAGRVVKTTGDGILAIFDGPGQAIRCAAALRAELRPLGLEVRAGLHTGEVERRGGDVGGIAVHIGARVAAGATAGEVLVSSTVRDLVIGSAFRFSDRGVHALKGVPGRWRLYAVRS
jgi:class 3 adenylate cyclase